MFWTVVGAILALIGVLAVLTGIGIKKRNAKASSYDEMPGGGISIGGGVVAVLLGGFAIVSGMSYTQDVGEVKVLRSFSGEVVDVDTTEGLAFKAPWVETIDFDIRNQQAIYKLDGNPTSPGEQVNGPEIEFQDKDKVTADADVAIRYSISEQKIGEIFDDYSSQEALTARLIDQDMRSVVRNAFSQYTTAGVMENRVQIEVDIVEALKSRWGDNGVIVESVALQGIRYPGDTQQGFTDAQKSATELKKAQNNLEVEKANAENALVKAQGEAKANQARSEALTPEVLTQQWIEAQREMSKNGTVFVVPEGSTPMVDVGSAVPKPQQEAAQQ